MAEADARALADWRRGQRTALIAARLALSTSAHRAASERIREHLDALLKQLRPEVVAGYWPIRQEFNPLPSLGAHLSSGARGALPVVTVKNAPLEFRLWSPDAPMAVGMYDIAYPAEGAAVLPDAMLIPMVGFDQAGYRLGYGGGYYDRTTALLEPRPLLIGIAFESALLETIHPLPHDVPMDYIVTEAATRDFRGASAAR